jgi:signal transduction histidine kinase/DNA-binding response OmpR family regulator
MAMADLIAKNSMRSAAETRTGIMTIILVSSMVFLLLEARKDVLSTLTSQEARLAMQFAAVAAQPDIARLKSVIDDPGRTWGADTDRLAPLPGQATITIPVTPDGRHDPMLALLGVNASTAEDTQGRFIIRNGALFAAMRNNESVVMTSAPIMSLTNGLFGRIGIDITCVVFLASLMLLIRESRLSDYSVRRLLDASPVPLVVLDAGGTVDFANAPAVGLFAEESSDSLEGVQKTLRDEQALFDWLTEDQQCESKVETREFEINRLRGSARCLLVSRQSLRVRSRRMTIASAVDITVRREAETALVRAKNAAEELGRLKSESLAIISHELRTPINGVLGLAEILTRQSLPQPAMRIANRLVQAGKTLGTLISDISDLGLLEARRLRFEQRPFDPRETITAAVTLASAAAPQKGLKVRVTIMAPLPPLVIGDASRLQQIIINLVGNSIKFTELGGVDVSVDVLAHDTSAMLVIEVADTGIGISPDVLPRIFQPFSQGETGRGRRYEGTGLGLAITRALAEAIGGTITVDSMLGQGSRFRVRLPYEIATTRSEEPPAPMASRVLVVDDVALNRDIVADLLRMEGCVVRTAASADEAIVALYAEGFDIVLMDIHMPVVDGLSASRAIRSYAGPRRHRGPIIGLTANPAPTDRPLYAWRGIDDILEKPVDADRIRAALRRSTAPKARLASPERVLHLEAALGSERARRVVASFRDVAEDAIESIVHQCSRLSFDGLAEHAHRLAGAASNLGLDGLADCATRLETMAREDGVLAISDAAFDTVESYNAVRRFVNAYLATAERNAA